MRHGETDSNVKRCFYGSLDVSINDNGIYQSKCLQQIMKNMSVHKIMTSDLKRTIETAQYVFKDAIIPFQKLSEMNEKGFGLWEGLNADEIQEQFPVEWQSWLDEPFTYVPPCAESFLDFKYRVYSGLDKILTEKIDDIACIFHLGVLRLIYQKLVDEHKVFWDIDFPQGSVTVLSFDNGKWQVDKILK